MGMVRGQVVNQPDYPPGGTEMKMFGPKEVDKNMDKNTIRKRMATFPLGVGKIETIVSSYSFLLAII